jgi:hypothetical protein
MTTIYGHNIDFLYVRADGGQHVISIALLEINDIVCNDSKPTQRQLRNIGNMSEVHFLGNEYNRPLPRKTHDGTINPVKQQRNS